MSLVDAANGRGVWDVALTGGLSRGHRTRCCLLAVLIAAASSCSTASGPEALEPEGRSEVGAGSATPSSEPAEPVGTSTSSTPLDATTSTTQPSIDLTISEAFFGTSNVNERFSVVGVDAGPLEPRLFPQVMWTGHEVVVWGGTSKGEALVDGAAYDPATQHWTPVVEAPVGSVGPYLATSVNGGFLVAGGMSADGAPSSAGGLYDRNSGEWTRVAGVEGKGVPQLTTVGGEAFALLGELDPGAGSERTLAVFDRSTMALIDTGVSIAPYGVLVGVDGDLYVAERSLGRIALYRVDTARWDLVPIELSRSQLDGRVESYSVVGAQDTLYLVDAINRRLDTVLIDLAAGEVTLAPPVPADNHLYHVAASAGTVTTLAFELDRSSLTWQATPLADLGVYDLASMMVDEGSAAAVIAGGQQCTELPDCVPSYDPSGALVVLLDP